MRVDPAITFDLPGTKLGTGFAPPTRVFEELLSGSSAPPAQLFPVSGAAVAPPTSLPDLTRKASESDSPVDQRADEAADRGISRLTAWPVAAPVALANPVGGATTVSGENEAGLTTVLDFVSAVDSTMDLIRSSSTAPSPNPSASFAGASALVIDWKSSSFTSESVVEPGGPDAASATSSPVDAPEASTDVLAPSGQSKSPAQASLVAAQTLTTALASFEPHVAVIPSGEPGLQAQAQVEVYPLAPAPIVAETTQSFPAIVVAVAQADQLDPEPPLGSSALTVQTLASSDPLIAPAQPVEPAPQTQVPTLIAVEAAQGLSVTSVAFVQPDQSPQVAQTIALVPSLATGTASPVVAVLPVQEVQAPRGSPPLPTASPLAPVDLDNHAPFAPPIPDTSARSAEVIRTTEARAFAFRELGWFDHGATAFRTVAPVDVAKTEALSQQPRKEDAAAGASAASAIDPASSIQPSDDALASGGGAGAFAALGHGGQDHGGEAILRISTSIASPGRSARTSVATRDDEAQAEGGFASGDRAVELDQPYRNIARSQSAVSVVVSERGGSMQVVAAAPQFGAEAGEKLRKLAGDMIAEHGLTLGEFSLNGAKIQRSRLG